MARYLGLVLLGVFIIFGIPILAGFTAAKLMDDPVLGVIAGVVVFIGASWAWWQTIKKKQKEIE